MYSLVYFIFHFAACKDCVWKGTARYVVPYPDELMLCVRNNVILTLALVVPTGADVCTLIENVKTNESDKPLDEIKILSVDVE
jgi:hypothetical protein